MAIQRGKGLTRSEKYLAHLCDSSFLSLWSYPNIYRDQGTKGETGHGMEICDLLVVCGDDLIIFSDKSCQLKDTGNLDVDWPRWYRRAILKSIRQVYGAERWLKGHPDRVFLDPECTRPLPLALGSLDRYRVHRIVVALGAAKRCQQTLGGSGSLVIGPDIVGNAHIDCHRPEYHPFFVGQWDVDQGFVHVLDDVTLDVVIRELDTITDFTAYLTKKEELIGRGALAIAAGEENLLAMYLMATNDQGVHEFVVPCDERIAVDDGYWRGFLKSAEYQRKKAADKPSYVWDAIIETFAQHVLGGTLLECPERTFAESEIGLRVMAQQPRVSRRMFGQAILDFMESAPKDKIASRTMHNPDKSGTAFVFQTMPFDGQDERQYRELRSAYLGDYCFVLSWKYRNLEQVIGIATEPGIDNQLRSHDMVYVKVDEWTPEREEAAKRTQEARKILVDEKSRRRHVHVDEYPSGEMGGVSEVPSARPKVGRNSKCPCGSERKYKRCCGRQ